MQKYETCDEPFEAVTIDYKHHLGELQRERDFIQKMFSTHLALLREHAIFSAMFPYIGLHEHLLYSGTIIHMKNVELKHTH